jgi:hypothetical protein
MQNNGIEMETEPEMEAFLVRLIPGLFAECEGASEEEIRLLQSFTSKPLPRFYIWFLRRMGRSMGPLSIPLIDFSVFSIVSWYNGDHGGFDVPDTDLLIGLDTDKRLIFYNLNVPNRNDALLQSTALDDYCPNNDFETFREMLGWSTHFRFRITKFPHFCSGYIRSNDKEIFRQINPILTDMGFIQPIATGLFCGIFDHVDAAMICSRTVYDIKYPLSLSFDLGGRNKELLRNILGKITSETSVFVEIKKWSTLE